jgi:hypothetical protein
MTIVAEACALDLTGMTALLDRWDGPFRASARTGGPIIEGIR